MKRLWNVLRRVSPRRLTSLQAYDLWAATYPPQAHNALMRMEQATMLALMPNLGEAVVLDLACGSGRYGRLAAEAGAAFVVSVDNSAAMLRANPQPNRVLAPMHHLPLASGSVDVVICGLAIGHFPQLSPILNEISRVLKPGGVALISDFHPAQVASGAQRTFTAGDRTYAVEHHVHWYATHHEAAHSARLTLQAVREPTLNGDLPVILVLRYGKD